MTGYTFEDIKSSADAKVGVYLPGCVQAKELSSIAYHQCTNEPRCVGVVHNCAQPFHLKNSATFWEESLLVILSGFLRTDRARKALQAVLSHLICARDPNLVVMCGLE